MLASRYVAARYFAAPLYRVTPPAVITDFIEIPVNPTASFENDGRAVAWEDDQRSIEWARA